MRLWQSNETNQRHDWHGRVRCTNLDEIIALGGNSGVLVGGKGSVLVVGGGCNARGADEGCHLEAF